MEKPSKKIIEYYDWLECIKYLEKKYNFDHRDYRGRFKNNSYIKEGEMFAIELGGSPEDLKENLVDADKSDPEVARKLKLRKDVERLYKEKGTPHLDFWHWVCDEEKFPTNDGYIYFDRKDLELKDTPDFVKTILKYILDEYGEGEYKKCAFAISW